MILTGNNFDQMTGILRANVNVVKIIRGNDVFSIKKTTFAIEIRLKKKGSSSCERISECLQKVISKIFCKLQF